MKIDPVSKCAALNDGRFGHGLRNYESHRNFKMLKCFSFETDSVTGVEHGTVVGIWRLSDRGW